VVVVVGSLHGAAIVAVGVALGWFAAGTAGALVGAGASAVPAWRGASAVARCRPYPADRRGAASAAIDVTWGALNAWAASLFALVLSARGNRLDVERSRGSGLVHFCDQAIAGYATTIGIVTAGCSPRVEAHERVHVLQARLLGPLYLPLVGLGFVVATVLPYWLASSSVRCQVRDVRSYFVRGVYRNTWHEWWAYRVAPTRPH
jgi:hypothetical protein